MANYDRYLQPEEGNASGLLSAAVMATMFFTPIGGKVMGAAFKGGLRTVKFAGMGVGLAGAGLLRYGTKPLLRGAWGAAKMGLSGARGVMGLAGKGLDFATRKKMLGPMLGIAAGAGAISAGLRHDNLGATGDLTLSLHHGR